MKSPWAACGSWVPPSWYPGWGGPHKVQPGPSHHPPHGGPMEQRWERSESAQNPSESILRPCWEEDLVPTSISQFHIGVGRPQGW